MTKHQLHQKDQIISPLIEQGQSPYQILTNHPELDMSVRSMYTYIDKGLFTARNIDLKRQAKFTPREILSERTPYEVALETLGEDILKAFQLKPIEPDKVNLTPKLIRFNH